jgi:chemotaxis protein MotA
MFSIIGIVVVLGAVIGGYLMEHGHLEVLFQPAELVIIGGAAVGTLLIANPLPTIKKLFAGMLGIMKGDPYSKAFYLENLKMINDLFGTARKNGLSKIEADIEEPDKSQLFGKYPSFLKDHHAVHFFCDTMRMATSGGVGAFELDQAMEVDMDVHHKEGHTPIEALTTVADALPGLGIVAAVLGVVITMGSLGGPPEEIGHKVAAALVGTFLGILMCYGFLAPIASMMGKRLDSEHCYYQFLRTAVTTFVKGNPPLVAAEFARRSIPGISRPSFKEMEQACKGGGSGS